MEVLVNVVKYGFAVLLVAEVVVVFRTLVLMALEKARPAAPQAPAAEE